MTENKEYFQMVKRVIIAAGRRAGDGDEFDLKFLADLESVVFESVCQAIVVQLHDNSASWAFVALSLGISRQAAHRKYSPRVNEIMRSKNYVS